MTVDRGRLVAGAVWLSLSVLVLGVWEFMRQERIEDIRRDTAVTAEQVGFRLEAFIETRIALVDHIRRDWLAGEVHDKVTFAHEALRVQETFSGFQAINWIDPQGVIRWVFPEEQNRAAKGMRARDRPISGPILELAERTGAPRATPPIDLAQGGKGFVVYLPLKRAGRLEGTVTAVFRVSELVEEALGKGLKENYYFRISDGDTAIYAFGKAPRSHPFLSRQRIEVLDRTWSITLMPKPARIVSGGGILGRIVLVAGLIFSAGLAWLLWLYLQRQRALRESEARFKDFANSASNWFWEIDSRFRFTHDTGRPAIVGLGLSELLGKTRWEIPGVDPDAEHWRRHRADLEAHRPIRDFEFSYRGHGGDLHYARISGQPVFNSDGKFQGYRGTAADITERTLAEDALRNSEERYRTLYKKTPVMLHSIDREGRLVDVSDAWLEGLGYAREEVIGRKIVEFMTGESRETTEKSQMPEFFRTGVLTNAPKQFMTRDGEVRDILLSAISERDKEGNFVRGLAVLNDITERKRANEALRESEERFRAIIEASPAPLLISRRSDGTILFANPKLGPALGLPADQMVGRSMAEFYADSSRRAELLAALGRDGFVNEFELELIRADGTTISTVHSLQGIKYQGETAIVGAFYDITKRKQDEAALLKANDGLARQRRELERLTEDLTAARDQADLANRTKSEFLANMSHELRTPLNAVIGFSTIISEGMFGPVGNPKYVEYANDINESGEHLLELINDILDLSKIEAGKLELHEQDVDVVQAVEACLTVVKERAEEANLRLETDFAEGLPPLKVDQLKLKQILINLLSNAVKFTPSGGTVGVRAFVEPGGGFAIEVSDTGVGIAAADIDEVMKPFTQVDGGLARRHQGTGLGLPMVKGLVELHQGTFEFESEVGVGTTARVRFPATRVREHAA